MLLSRNQLFKQSENSLKRSILLTSAVTLHNILEGLAVGISFWLCINWVARHFGIKRDHAYYGNWSAKYSGRGLRFNSVKTWRYVKVKKFHARSGIRCRWTYCRNNWCALLIKTVICYFASSLSVFFLRMELFPYLYTRSAFIREKVTVVSDTIIQFVYIEIIKYQFASCQNRQCQIEHPGSCVLWFNIKKHVVAFVEYERLFSR